jgi:(p)ppGpp synthase/HD superfamily hydrolase
MPIDQPSANNERLGRRFAEALQFAADVHRCDSRKGSDVPYVGHMLGVCSLVLEEGGSEDQAIAALLHDAAEDHGGAEMLEQIDSRFGPAVMEIVEACSDTLESPKPPWRVRKERHLDRLAREPDSVLLVSLADKLYNARAITRDYKSVGERLWSRFKTERDEQLWYYRSLSQTFVRRMPRCLMTGELVAVLDELDQLIATRKSRCESALPAPVHERRGK